MSFRLALGSEKSKARERARIIRRILGENRRLPELPETFSEKLINEITNRVGTVVKESAFKNGGTVVQAIDGKILKIDQFGNTEIIGEITQSTVQLPAFFRLV